MKSLLALAVISLLAGCASAPLPPKVEVVKEIVPVPCKVPTIARPEFEVEKLPVGSDIWDQMMALRLERRQRMSYEVQLETAVKACQ